jgi:hypothetical protein
MMGIEQYPISELTDLQEVLHMTYNLKITTTGILSYKLKFLKEDFLPLYFTSLQKLGQMVKTAK